MNRPSIRLLARRHRMLIAFVFTCISILILLRFMGQPALVHSIRHLRTTLAVTDAMESASPSNFDSLLSERRIMLKELSRIRASLPADAKSSVVLDSVLALAREQGLQVMDISAITESRNGRWTEYPFSLRVSGAFPAIHNFVHAMETSPLVIEIRSWNMKTKSNGVLEAEFMILAYIPHTPRGPS